MTTQALLADGLITYSYVASAVRHKLNVRVNLRRDTLEVGTMPHFQDNSNGAVSNDADEFTLLFLPNLLKGYVAGDHFDSYRVLDMSTSPPTWIFEKSITGYVGTHTGASFQTSEGETVFTFRDARGKQSKMLLLGNIDPRLSKKTVIGSDWWSDLVTDLLSRAIDHSGAFVSGRGGKGFVAFVSACGSSNNAIERKLVFG